MQADVGIIMGSDSDLDVMSECCRVLEKLSVNFECTVVSAHRTPERMFNYAREASGRGIRVIIAGAGGAAHLPGMVAACTDLPVIGVPVRSSNLQGLDSLLSIVQMPRGIPVATVAINGSRNAGLLAARILAISNDELAKRLARYREHSRDEVEKKASELETRGYETYLEQMGRHSE